MTNTITHWINNKPPFPGASGATAAVDQSGDRCAVTGEVALGQCGGMPGRVIDSGGPRRSRGGRDNLVGQAGARFCSTSAKLLHRRKGETRPKIITAEHGKVVSDAPR